MTYTTLYIGGAGRSGSTLLEILLGNQQNLVCVGEVREYFHYLSDNNMPCGCGEYIHKCDFWQKVNESLEQQGVDLNKIADISKRLTQSRIFWKLPLLRKFSSDWSTLVESTRALYDTVASISGAKYIIDSSKSATHLAVLKEFKSKDELKVIHQIRDPRGVAYSWSQNIKQIKTKNGPVEFPRRAFFMSGIRWLLENLVMEYMSRDLDYTRVSYEAMTENPRQTIVGALNTIGLPAEEFEISTEEQRVITLQPHISHPIGGNPMRKSADGAKIICDTKWKSELSTANKLGLGLITYPGLKRYGYKLRW
ncbi:MAG: hypothetical protein ACJATK_000116 [Paracoccaceae bacterium]|jgi:hypothetical protein